MRVDTKLNKIRVLCLFAGGRSHRRGGFFVRWGRRAPPVPAAAGVNLLRFPRPRRGRGTGGGRGEGCGRKRRGKKDQAADRHGAEQARAPTRRRRGRRSTAPEERPKGRRGGNGGPRPPVWAQARQGGCRGCRDRPGAARERPRRGRGQAAADPRLRRGLPMRPTLFAPAQTPGGGEHGAGGARSGGQGGGSRRKAGPQLRPPRRPAARSAIPKGRRPAKKESAQAIKARTLSQVTRGSTPCRVIVPQRRRCCQAPGGGGPPLLDNRTLFRHRGPQGPLWPG